VSNGIPFIKMHGLGNDYVYIDTTISAAPDPETLAQRMSDRHFGIGSDGLVLIMPSHVADARMRIFNADGSEATMCGNALRCIAKYVMEHRIGSYRPVSIETPAGVRQAEPRLANGRLVGITIAMGHPEFAAGQVPVVAPDSEFIASELDVTGAGIRWTAVSVGNPHVVTFDLDPAVHAGTTGPKIEWHPRFPARVNVNFAQISSRTEIVLRVWERGSGLTLACGSGATATFAAARRLGLVEARATVILPGGSLLIEEQLDGALLMTGPATAVFAGTWWDEEAGTLYKP